MPQHTKQHLDTFVATFEKALTKATKIFEEKKKKIEEQQKSRRANL